jgi:hypothetical protein
MYTCRRLQWQSFLNHIPAKSVRTSPPAWSRLRHFCGRI